MRVIQYLELQHKEDREEDDKQAEQDHRNSHQVSLYSKH